MATPFDPSSSRDVFSATNTDESHLLGWDLSTLVCTACYETITPIAGQSLTEAKREHKCNTPLAFAKSIYTERQEQAALSRPLQKAEVSSTGQPHCPRCGSDDASRSRRRLRLHERILLFALPYRCGFCNHRYKAFGMTTDRALPSR